MTNDELLFVRVIFTGLFFAVLFSGWVLYKNYDRLFGPDPDMPSQGESARAYNKIQVFAVWAHAVLLTGAFALLLH